MSDDLLFIIAAELGAICLFLTVLLGVLGYVLISEIRRPRQPQPVFMQIPGMEDHMPGKEDSDDPKGKKSDGHGKYL